MNEAQIPSHNHRLCTSLHGESRFEKSTRTAYGPLRLLFQSIQYTDANGQTDLRSIALNIDADAHLPPQPKGPG